MNFDITGNMAQSFFSGIEAAAPIEVFALSSAYNEDTNPKKVSLGVGGLYFLCTSVKVLSLWTERTHSIATLSVTQGDLGFGLGFIHILVANRVPTSFIDIIKLRDIRFRRRGKGYVLGEVH